MAIVETELITVQSGYDRKTCWVHARPGVIPGDPLRALITMQKLRLTGEDIFYELHDIRSDDGGRTWSQPVSHFESLGRRPDSGGVEEGISDFTPAWHSASGVLLGTGHTVRYFGDELEEVPRRRDTGYSVYYPETRSWSVWEKLALPAGKEFFNEGAGCTQRVDLPNGDVLLPTYVGRTVDGPYQDFASTVLRCSFDGKSLKYLEHGEALFHPRGRGFVEPSLASARGEFFLTLRNDNSGYVSRSRDGLNYSDPQPWTFDDGSDLGNYNTQQHWVTHGDELWLIYNRRAANNHHIFRHRAPLFIGRVDLDNLCIVRETEQILVPEKGARLGNFGVTQVSDSETWVVASEWMQTTLPHWNDFSACEKYGRNNSIFLAKIRFQ